MSTIELKEMELTLLTTSESSEIDGGWPKAMYWIASMNNFMDGLSEGFQEGFGQWVDNGFL
jgi:hypothetical protein